MRELVEACEKALATLVANRYDGLNGNLQDLEHFESILIHLELELAKAISRARGIDTYLDKQG